MKTVVLEICIIALLGSYAAADLEEPVADYYWRDYAGIVPDDAVPGGLDINNKTTYIGQGFVKDVGIIPGMIYPGERSLKVSAWGVKNVENYIKILCSPKVNAMKWLSVTSSNFFVVTINKYLIPGGIENNYYLNIGRIAYQRQVVIGKIVTGSPDYRGQAPMFFVDKNQEVFNNYYEVLMYDNDKAINLM